MKNLFNYSRFMTLMAIAACTLTFTACGGDENEDLNWGKFDTKLDTPKYENVSALYQVTDNTSDISSIELTASGNYIVITNYGSRAQETEQVAAKKHFFISKRMNHMTRAGSNHVVEGKFKQLSDTKFELEGWGIIEVQGSSNNALSIKITRNGVTSTVPVAKKTQMENKEKTNYLCRTWDFSSIRMILKMDGSSVYDKEYKMTELKNFGRDMYELYKKYYPKEMEDETLEEYLEDWELDDYPTGVIFTKSGTYMCLYRDEELAVSTWTWENYDTGLLRYSWNYQNMYDPYQSGNVKVGSRGSELQISESFSNRNSYYEEEQNNEVTMIYFLKEAK